MKTFHFLFCLFLPFPLPLPFFHFLYFCFSFRLFLCCDVEFHRFVFFSFLHFIWWVACTWTSMTQRVKFLSSFLFFSSFASHVSYLLCWSHHVMTSMLMMERQFCVVYFLCCVKAKLSCCSVTVLTLFLNASHRYCTCHSLCYKHCIALISSQSDIKTSHKFTVRK